MAKNILINGQLRPGVSEVELPTASGSAVFRDEDEIQPAGLNHQHFTVHGNDWSVSGLDLTGAEIVYLTFRATTNATEQTGYKLYSGTILAKAPVANLPDAPYSTVSAGSEVTHNNDYKDFNKLVVASYINADSQARNQVPAVTISTGGFKIQPPTAYIATDLDYDIDVYFI